MHLFVLWVRIDGAGDRFEEYMSHLADGIGALWIVMQA